MESLFNAIKSNDINKVKDIIVANRPAVRKLHLYDLFRFVTDTEMLRTLFFMCRHEVMKYQKKFRRTILHDAIDDGKDLKIIEAIIKLDKGLINRIDTSGMTPLNQAVRLNKELRLIKFLLKNNADVNICDLYGLFPIHYANNLKVAKLLIKNGAQVNCVDNDGCTPIMTALQEMRDRMIVLEFIKIGADLTVRNRDGQTYLHLVLLYKYDEEIFNQVCCNNFDYNVEDDAGLTPLCFALNTFYRDGLRPYRQYFIKNLINKGFAMNNKVFMHAVKNSSDVEMIASLLKYVDVRCVDEDGNCVLHYAHDAQLINMLARRGAPINHENNRGMTPLAYSIKFTQSYSFETIESLLFWGADIKNLDVAKRRCLDDRIYDLFVLYGMSVSLKNDLIKFSLSSSLDGIAKYGIEIYVQSRCLLGHIFISNETVMVPEEFRTNKNVTDLIANFSSELNKMKEEILIDNTSYYDFCMKKYKAIRSPFVYQEFTEADYENIKILFPTFYNEVIVKIMINTKIHERKALLRKLMNVSLTKRRESVCNADVDSSFVYDELDFDCMYNLGSFLSDREINCLLTAAIID